MLSDRIIINKQFGTSIVSLIGNPLVQLALSIIVGVFFLVISISQKSPYYYLSQPIPVARQTTPDLILEYNHKKIKNLYSIDLVLWNNGSNFIEQSDFIDSTLIKFNSGGAVQLLSSKIIVKSRAGLKFSTSILENNLYVKMIGDEAIEQGDGLALRVYYTLKNSKQPKFSLSSRVKGTREGFEHKDLRKVGKAVHKPILIIGWCLIILLLLLRAITLLIVRKPIVFRTGEIILLSLAICIWSYYTYEYLYLTVELEWLDIVIR
jgi:hypothetical protein